MPTPDVNNGANPNIVPLNPADDTPTPIVPAGEPVVDPPRVEALTPADEVENEEEPPAREEDDPASHPVYYEAVSVADDDPSRLKFRRPPTAEAPPPAVRAMRRQVEDVSRLVRILFQDDEARRKQFVGQLKEAAESGLVGPNSNVEIGLENLQDVKDGIADAYTAIRSKLWRANLVLLGSAIACCGIASAAFLFLGAQSLWLATSGWPMYIAIGLMIFLGTMAGLFLEFIFRVNDDIPYDQLRAINPGRWKPLHRAMNTTIVAAIFAAILAAKIFQVGVGSVLLNDFVTKSWLAVVIGFVTGFAFPYVRDLVQQVRPVSRT